MQPTMNRTILFILLLASLLLAGCWGFGRGGGNDDITNTNTNFHTGSQGIWFQFQSNAPPAYVYDTFGANSKEIVVLIELHNRGAFSGRDGQGAPVALYLGGFDQTIIRLPTAYFGTINLRGKSLFNAEGERAVAQFPDDSYNGGFDGSIMLPPNADIYSPDLQVTACYYYETDATVMTCISPDPYRITTQQVCYPGTVRGGTGSQGAPVAVSSVQAQNIPGEAIFQIRISNVGGGRVVDQITVPVTGGYGGKCPYQLEYMDMNTIDYEVSFQGITINSNPRGGGGSGNTYCEPGQIKLNNGYAELYCRFSIGVGQGQQSAYETPLMVKLKYGYMDSRIRHIEIRSLVV